jgi:hypothetical protein
MALAVAKSSARQRYVCPDIGVGIPFTPGSSNLRQEWRSQMAVFDAVSNAMNPLLCPSAPLSFRSAPGGISSL